MAPWIFHLVDEFPVHTADGVAPVPVELVGTGRLQGLAPNGGLEAGPAQAWLAAHTLLTGQALLAEQVVLGGSPGKIGAGVPADQAVQVCAAHAAGLLDGFPVAKELLLLLKQPDGCLKREDRAAATARGLDHAHTLSQCLSTLVLSDG